LGQTIIEKILSAHSGQEAYANEIVVAHVDFVMGQDGTSPLAIRAFESMEGKEVFDTEKVAFVIDHSSPSPLEGVSALHKLMREFSGSKGFRLYDIGEGVCHQLIPESGKVGPGSLVIGADSHTCTYGALNAFSTGVGSTDLAGGLISGKMWFKVPETIKFVCNGVLPRGVYAKDLILHLIGDVTADGATYMSAEYVGDAVSALSMEGRFTMANMAIEMGAKAGMMEADDKTMAWLARYTDEKFIPVMADSDAIYAAVKEYDVSSLEPQVAKPHRVDNLPRGRGSRHSSAAGLHRHLHQRQAGGFAECRSHHEGQEDSPGCEIYCGPRLQKNISGGHAGRYAGNPGGSRGGGGDPGLRALCGDSQWCALGRRECNFHRQP